MSTPSVSTTTPTSLRIPSQRTAVSFDDGSEVATTTTPRVPWLTVFSLAVPMAAAASFWIVSMRTSLGSIVRSDSPSMSWLREGAIALPAFVLAVLGALVLAQRHLGRDATTLRQVARTTLFVTVAGTVVGVVQLALSSAYDYHLQSAEQSSMSGMADMPGMEHTQGMQGMPGCAADCQASMQHAALALQQRSVLIGAGVLLVANLVLVVWVAAARGGRLPLLARRSAVPRVPVLDRLGAAHVVLATTLAGSAAIHAAVVPEHLEEWWAAGSFFVVLTGAELVLALAVVLTVLLRRRAPSPLLLLTCLAASLGPLLLWAESRTAGLPFGPEPGVPEAVGLADVAACLLELLTVAAAVQLLRGHGGLVPARVVRPHRTRLALVAVVAVTAVGLGGTELSWLSLQVGEMHMGGADAAHHLGVPGPAAASRST